MHQQTHCHALSKPFSKIFLFRIYAPTVQTHPHHIDSIFAETSVPVSTNTHAHTTPTNQSTNDTAHTYHAPQIPHPYSPTNTHANQSTSDTVPQPHSTDSAPIQPHKHTQPHSPTNTHNHTQPPTDTHSLHTHTASTDTHRHATQPRPPTLTLSTHPTQTLTPLHRR